MALLFFAGSAQAADVALIGVIGDKAGVFAVDGGEPKTVKVGQTWNGITVITVQKDRAVVEVEGRRRELAIGQHNRAAAPADTRQSVKLAADPRGHFFADVAVNDVPMRFVVDTGASVVTIPAGDATRMGINWRKGTRSQMQTANGATVGYIVTLDKVRLGGIELHNVDAVVLEQGLGSFGLLGMSFLNRLQMQRDGETLTLIRRF